jgi:photosystem II stability/assembly factor-like uncharacterized protein
MNKFLLYGIILGLFFTTIKAQWIKTGFESDARVTCIVAKEGNLFAGTWGKGVLKSTDGGAIWTTVLNGYYTSALAVAPSSSGNGTNIFASMRDGLWRSTDDGNNWTLVFSEEDYHYFISLGVTGSTILGGVRQSGTNGVYRSDNDGVSWSRSNAGFATAADSNVSCFATITSGGTTYTYVGTDGGVFVSTTNGAGWTKISNGLPTGITFSILAVPRAKGATGIDLYAGIGQYGLYHSSDNGVSWNAANEGIFNRGSLPSIQILITSLAASFVPGGTNNTIFAVDGAVYVSTDDGAQWWNTDNEITTKGWIEYLCINGGTLYGAGADSSSYTIWKYNAAQDTGWVVQPCGTVNNLLTVKAVDNNIVWAGGANGEVLKTTDGGKNWTSAGGGIIGTDSIESIEALDANTAFISIYSGNSGKILKTTNGGLSWSLVSSVIGVAIGGMQMKTSLEGYAIGSPLGGKWIVLKTIDGGNTWQNMETAPPEDSLTSIIQGYYGPLILRPAGVQLSGDMISFGSVSGMVYHSTNLGTTWNDYPVGKSDFILSALHFNSLNIGMAGSGFIAYVTAGLTSNTTDGGISWNSESPVSTKNVTCISGLGNEFWATTGGSIAYTKNNGQAWSFSTPGHWGSVPLNALSFSPNSIQLNGWAVGNSGLILHYQRGGATSVLRDGQSLPTTYSLSQNYPNPFNPSTIISYQLPINGNVSLKIFNSLGQVVETLINKEMPAGSYTQQWNAAGMPSGIYFYTLHAGNFIQTNKMIFMK